MKRRVPGNFWMMSDSETIQNCLVARAGFAPALSRLQNTAYELGVSVAADGGALTELLPELVRTRSDQSWSFGRGLAQGANDPSSIWKQLVGQLQSVPMEAATPWVFRGFLDGLHQTNAALAGAMLDDAIDNSALAQWYPALETAIGEIHEQGLGRLLRSLELGEAPIHNYRSLEGGRVTDGLSGPNLKTLLLRISDHDEGIYVAVEILYMRLFSDGVSVSPKEFVEIGCELMRRLNITRDTGPNFAQRLQIIGKHCLIGDAGAATVREVCTKLKEAISRSEASAYGHREFLQVLFSAQPLAVLQSLCSGDATMVKIGISVLENADLLHPHPFDVIPEGELFRWCNELPDVRYPIAASGIAAIRQDMDGPHWTDIALKILEKSPDRVRVLQKFIRQFSCRVGIYRELRRSRQTCNFSMTLLATPIPSSPSSLKARNRDYRRRSLRRGRYGPRFTWSGTKAALSKSTKPSGRAVPFEPTRVLPQSCDQCDVNNVGTLARYCWPARLQFTEPTRVHRQIGLGPVPQLL
jgi:hypothetical protein